MLPPSRYRDGRIYIDAAELQSLTAGELFISLPGVRKRSGYVRELLLDEGRAAVTLPGMRRDPPE